MLLFYLFGRGKLTRPPCADRSVVYTILFVPSYATWWAPATDGTFVMNLPAPLTMPITGPRVEVAVRPEITVGLGVIDQLVASAGVVHDSSSGEIVYAGAVPDELSPARA